MRPPRARRVAGALALILVALAHRSRAESPDTVWWEGEKPTETNFPKRTWFSPQNAREADLLSAGAWLSNSGKRTGPEAFAKYRVSVPAAAEYDFWVRKFWKHGPFRWRFGEQEW